MKLLLHRQNFYSYYPNGVKWPNMFAGDTTYVLPQRIQIVSELGYQPRRVTYPEDILELYRKKFKGTKHLQQCKVWHKKWQYMIDRSKELINEK